MVRPKDGSKWYRQPPWRYESKSFGDRPRPTQPKRSAVPKLEWNWFVLSASTHVVAAVHGLLLLNRRCHSRHREKKSAHTSTRPIFQGFDCRTPTRLRTQPTRNGVALEEQGGGGSGGGGGCCDPSPDPSRSTARRRSHVSHVDAEAVCFAESRSPRRMQLQKRSSHGDRTDIAPWPMAEARLQCSWGGTTKGGHEPRRHWPGFERPLSAREDELPARLGGRPPPVRVLDHIVTYVQYLISF